MIYLSDNPNLNYGLTAFSSEYTNGKMYLRSFGGNVNDIGKKEIKIKTWYMASITVDNAKNEAKHYLNGELYATTTAGTVTSVDGLNTSVLGTTRHKTSPFFKGKIDDVSIYNCIIDSTEIDKLYTPNKSSSFTPLNANKEFEIKIFPNPATNYIQFEIISNLNNLTIENVAVYDLKGSKLSESTLSRQMKMSIQDLAQGPYILLIQLSDGSRRSVRFIK